MIEIRAKFRNFAFGMSHFVLLFVESQSLEADCSNTGQLKRNSHFSCIVQTECVRYFSCELSEVITLISWHFSASYHDNFLTNGSQAKYQNQATSSNDTYYSQWLLWHFLSIRITVPSIYQQRNKKTFFMTVNIILEVMVFSILVLVLFWSR